ncbi:MAG: HEPN domain protein [Firmicutes bacterium ADurb.Bin373]|nr:MAG: HEPN domain protein [Firmicutes bacterium ADurb.Bin373]
MEELKPQTLNWIEIADEDHEVAGHLFNNKKYLHCLFFCQQAIEKAVKAVYYDKYNKTPPRKHDLVALAKNAGIFSEMDEIRKDLFVLLSQYYIESRYAEDRKELAKNCTRAVSEDIIKKTSEVLKWLKSKLK